MDDMKDKLKGFMKKMSISSSSGGKFQGQGRVLGSASSSASNPSAPIRPSPTFPQRRIPRSTSPKSSVPPPPTPPSDPQKVLGKFDPFDPLITSSVRSSGAPEIETFECPVCSLSFPSEDAVSIHLDECLGGDLSDGPRGDIAECVSKFMTEESPKESVEVVSKLLKNLVGDPRSDRFRRIRMGNPKIKAALGDMSSGIELLECAGFRLMEDSGEVFAVMDDPSAEQLRVIKEMVSLIEMWSPGNGSAPSSSIEKTSDVVEEKKIDRKVQVFFPVPESVATKIDVPDSFYNVSADEVKSEIIQRKKKLEDSQLLVPKSYRAKQALAAKKRHLSTIIRIQFPDRVVLQGLFRPSESTTTLYEFVSSALKQPVLDFELLQPATPKPRVIPRLPEAGERMPTLEDAGLVPSAFLRFKPMENELTPFTGLLDRLLEASKPIQDST